MKDTVDMDNIGLKGSPTRVMKSFTKQAKGIGTVLKDADADDAVEAIMKLLKEKFVI